MYQVIKQTKEEQIKLYMKCTKKELSEMLYECNRIINSKSPTISECNFYIAGDNTAGNCVVCEKPQYLHNQYK